MKLHIHHMALMLILWAYPQPLFALAGYLRDYNLGIDYTSSYDSMEVTYRTSKATAQPTTSCEAVSDSSKQLCRTKIAAGGSSGFGVFLQQPFRRQGDFYFNYDIGFGLRYLSGALSSDERENAASRGLPLKEASFQLAALVVKPYIQFGITPSSSLPDILLSVGPVLQLTTGNVSINDESKTVVLGTNSGIRGFSELEIVLWRFGDGAFSLLTSHDFSGGDDEGTPFYPKKVDGMEDFRVSFSRSVGGLAFGFGLKLLTNWP